MVTICLAIPQAAQAHDTRKQRINYQRCVSQDVTLQDRGDKKPKMA